MGGRMLQRRRNRPSGKRGDFFGEERPSASPGAGVNENVASVVSTPSPEGLPEDLPQELLKEPSVEIATLLPSEERFRFRSGLAAVAREIADRIFGTEP